jgi:tripartite-type tricarboxylate transporter receptor subunit TctC
MTVIARGLLLIALLAALGAASPAAADYPDRAIEMIITFPPGGPTDTAARVVQPFLAKALGVPVVLVNKGGSGGAVAMDAVAKAKPDGYTVAATVRSTVSITPAVQANVPYRLRDFEMIGAYAASAQALVVKKGAPWKTLEELIGDARANPGKLSYGSAGQGTNSHLTMELLKLARSIDLGHVPFQGSGPLKSAVLGGHVQVGSISLSTMIPLIKSGDVVALVISGDKRNPAVPDVPTMAEKGVPEASLSTVMELYAPAKTPKPVVDRLAAALATAMKNPETAVALDKAGLELYHQPPDVSRREAEREAEVVLAAAKKLGLAK